MTTSFDMTALGVNKKVARGVPLSNAGATSLDVLTLNHNIGATPDSIQAVPVTIRSTVSGTGVNAVVLSRGATTATVLMRSMAAANVDWDFVVERTHSLIA